MGKRISLAVALLPWLCTACGSGGGGSAGQGSAANAAFGVVRLVDHTPVADAVQVALDATIQLQFDADMALESFGDEDTWLRAVGTTDDVPCTFTRGASGRVACRPDAPLAAETDYVFQLSALTSDLNGRILDVTTSFTFRTYDATPPAVLGVDVAEGTQDVDRLRTFTLTFDEAIAPASVQPATLYLRDGFGFRHPCDYAFDGALLTLDPRADLPGDRQFYLVVTNAVTDRAGNPLPQSFQLGFRTASDSDAPAVTTSWPPLNATGMSPRTQPMFRFDESMDPATVEAASLLFQDEFGSIVPFAIQASPDQRTLRVVPRVTLQPNRRYTLAFLLGAAAATDVSGNPLAATQALSFRTGDDQTPPAIASSTPTPGESRVPGTLVAQVAFDEDLDPAFVDPDTVTLDVGGVRWTSLVELVGGNTVRVTPVLTLPTETACTLRLRGGQDGLHDVAGNVLAADATVSFTTSSDAELPRVLMLPPDGSVGIARQSRVSLVFDAAMDPTTLTPTAIRVTDDYDNPIAGTLAVGAGDRVVTFTPASPLAADAYYRVRVRGGSSGVRRVSGNWFDTDQTARFRTAQIVDGVPPTVTATINALPSQRRDGLVVPPAGFTIEVTANDANGQWADVGSIEVLLEGGAGPSPAALLADAAIGYDSLSVRVPASTPLAAGAWTLTVRCKDLSGNVGSSPSLSFAVDEPTAESLPFERTQVVWVRTDLDRDNNGRPDFADDMLRLGFATAGDPLGTNAYMERLVRDGVLAKANRLYRRGVRGEPLDEGSVGLRFTTRQPIALAHMQISLGGLDPEGDRTRTYGDESTGILGRAYYDSRNGNVAERNVGSSPGLGVFPAEMWLYQSRIHTQVWPSFQTVFAQRFLPICPSMGGTPAGSHALDPVVLQPTFDYATATNAQRARWQALMEAADDWAAVIGVILAHEVGHSVGLVAPGTMPTGLFGDSSLHDTFAGAAEVMAPSVGYEAMTTLDYGFRDVDLAYLRQRLLLR